MPLRQVAEAQLGGINRHVMRQLVNGAFDREAADRLPRRSHEGIGHYVEIEMALDDLEALRTVKRAACRLRSAKG
jgi:hypothetical protein